MYFWTKLLFNYRSLLDFSPFFKNIVKVSKLAFSESLLHCAMETDYEKSG